LFFLTSSIWPQTLLSGTDPVVTNGVNGVKSITSQKVIQTTKKYKTVLVLMIYSGDMHDLSKRENNQIGKKKQKF